MSRWEIPVTFFRGLVLVIAQSGLVVFGLTDQFELLQSQITTKNYQRVSITAGLNL